MRELSTLENFSRNARTHSDEQIQQLAASIRAFGFVGAVIIRDGVIAKGHGTTAAAKLIYGEGGLIYPAPGKDAGAIAFKTGTLPVIDAGAWSDEQFAAFVVADNKLGLNSSWSMSQLISELKTLEVDGVELQLLGFNDAELASFFPPSNSDLLDEWGGMPEFRQNNQMPHRTLRIHFDRDADVNAFEKLVGQPISEKTKYLWFPQKQRLDTESKRIVTKDEE